MILFLSPYFQKKPWAGKLISEEYNTAEGVGEAWIVSGYPKKSSIIKNGVYKGKTLRYLWNNHKELFGFLNDKEFPLLLKLISSSDKLSIQVHPNDYYAYEKENQIGKYECWYVLEGNKSKQIINGLNVRNAVELREIIKNNELEPYINYSDIKKDDLVIISPGRIHALLEDSYVLEIQESSDVTYRLFDYNRVPKRELHIEDCLNVIDYNNKNNNIFNMEENEEYSSDFFKVEKHIINGDVSFGNDYFCIIYVLEGKGNVNGEAISHGDAFIVTSETTTINIEGDLKVLCVFPKKKKESRLKMRKIALITGITSSTGFYLTELLLSKNYEVHGVIQSEKQIMNSALNVFSSNKNFFTHIGDITDTSNINRILEQVKPDEIYHMACQSHIDSSFEMPEYTTQVNSLGTLRLLDAIKNSEINTKLFNMSTCYLFSGDIYPQNENTKFDPKSPYAISKLFAYYSVINYRENYNIYAVNGICYNQFSPINESSSVVNKIVSGVKRIKNGEDYCLELGNIDSEREWGYAKDYAQAMWVSLQLDNPDDFVISTGKSCSVRKIVEMAFKKINIDIKWIGTGLDEQGIDAKTNKVYVKINKVFFRPYDGKVLVGDSTKFYNKTKYNLENDVEKLIDLMMEE